MKLINTIIRLVLRFYVLHILFWVWNIISFAHVLEARKGGTQIGNLGSSALYKLCEIMAVYITILYLMPRFFDRGRFGLFALSTFGVITAAALLNTLTDELYTFYQTGRHLRSYFIKIASSVFDISVIVAVFTAIYIIYNKIKGDLRNRKQESERMKAELDFLRAQINPHFLFNTINNIYILIGEEPNKGREMMLRFSELLRYQLYECNEGAISVLKELQFIRNFIAMEQLRVGDSVHVEMDIPEGQNYFEIQPFILLPFVENAFKHVSRHERKRNFISIRCRSCHGVFHFTVWNTTAEHITARPGGLGLMNLRRRLELVYPGKYSLDIKEEEEIHYIDFKLYVR